MAKSSLKVNFDAMSTAKTDYAEYSERMTSLKNKLKEAVSGLRGGWDSDGGDAFFEKFDNTWEKSFTDYIDVIDHMAQQIQSSADKYNEVLTAAQTVADKAIAL